MALDVAGNAYLIGFTNSASDIATPTAYQSTLAGGTDAFLAKFDASGTRLWGSYYGGNDYDAARVCAVDAHENVYLAGETRSTGGIVSTGVYQPILLGDRDAFLVKFDASGTRQWGTYFGGTDWEDAYGCTVDASGNIYLVGYTYSTNALATAGAHQSTPGGDMDGFLAKFNSTGGREWATYYGGEWVERESACAVMANGDVVIAGLSRSQLNIATSTGYQPTFGGDTDAFLVRFAPNGTRLWGTYYGEGNFDGAYGCAITATGAIYIAGVSLGATGLATPGTHQSTHAGDADALLVRFEDAGTSVLSLHPEPLPITLYQAADRLIVKGDLTRASRIRLVDGLGRVVWAVQVNDLEASFVLPSELSSGVYTAQVLSREGKLLAQRRLGWSD